MSGGESGDSCHKVTGAVNHYVMLRSVMRYPRPQHGAAGGWNWARHLARWPIWRRVTMIKLWSAEGGFRSRAEVDIRPVVDR